MKTRAELEREIAQLEYEGRREGASITLKFNHADILRKQIERGEYAPEPAAS